jgi:hypothetical protein
LAVISFSREKADFATALASAEQLARLVPGDREIANLVETIRRETEKKNVERSLSALLFGLPNPDRIPLHNGIGVFDRRRRDRTIALPIWTGDSSRGIDQEPFVSKIASVRRYSNACEIVPLPWKLITNAGYFVRGFAKRSEH